MVIHTAIPAAVFAVCALPAQLVAFRLIEGPDWYKKESQNVIGGSDE